MISKNNADEVYFLGNRQTRKPYRLMVTITLLLVVCSGVAVYCGTLKSGINKSDTVYGKKLPELTALPDNATAPKFEGKHDFSKFMEWLALNLKYPKGLETQNAKVVVSFLITRDGAIDDIKIVSQPRQEAFAKEVVRLLRVCPRWSPGTLADGTRVDIRYTLPVNFSNVKRFD